MRKVNALEVQVELLPQLETCFVMEGQTATITCQVNLVEEKVVWFKNAEELKPSDHVEIVREGLSSHLIIHESTFTDQAIYTSIVGGDRCVATQLIVEGIVKTFQFLGICIFKIYLCRKTPGSGAESKAILYFNRINCHHHV